MCPALCGPGQGVEGPHTRQPPAGVALRCADGICLILRQKAPLPESTARLHLLSNLLIKGFEQTFVPMFEKFPSLKTG